MKEELLLNFVKENNPCVSSFGKFEVLEKKHFYIIDCELITSLENPFTNLIPITCKVSKKSFNNWKQNLNGVIFY